MSLYFLKIQNKLVEIRDKSKENINNGYKIFKNKKSMAKIKK